MSSGVYVSILAGDTQTHLNFGGIGGFSELRPMVAAIEKIVIEASFQQTRSWADTAMHLGYSRQGLYQQCRAVGVNRVLLSSRR